MNDTTITPEQIAIAIPPGPARERAMKRIHEHEVALRARAFRAAVLAGDYKRAGELLLAEVGGLERRALVLELEGDEPVQLAKNSTRRVLEVLCGVHGNPAVLKRALVPDEKIAPWVVVTSSVSMMPQRRRLEPREVALLERAGAGEYVQDPERETMPTPELSRYRGVAFHQGESIAWKRETWDAIVAVDTAIAEAVANGQIVVEAMSIEECRARMPVQP
ncbi:MAG: hypothetical protein JO257_05975 [Deltaproteobacteria bacterium]|nr:hypothetical protein [Deltaproteobacteria bacterium]